jgi:hypothetical protein
VERLEGLDLKVSVEILIGIQRKVSQQETLHMNIAPDSPAFVSYFWEVIYPHLFELSRDTNTSLAEMDKLLQLSFQIAKPVFDIPDVVRDGLGGRIRKPFLQNRILRSLRARFDEFQRQASAPPLVALREPLRDKLDKAQLDFMVRRKAEYLTRYPEMSNDVALIKAVLDWDVRCMWRP